MVKKILEKKFWKIPVYGISPYLLYMKVIITENQILELMDSFLNLSYNPNTREFYINNTEEVIGYKDRGGFTYAGYGKEDVIHSLFGKNTNKLLLIYLNEKFPDLNIRKIND